MRTTHRRNLLLPLFALWFWCGTATAQFPLKDGDIWVMAGDSITAQHLHSNYFEAFCFARYPQLKFAFRNSGVSGHTIPTTLARFEYDIAAWKPTVVSVELGMNDAGGTPSDKFLANMETMVERIRKTGARPVILSASPVNDGTTMQQLAGRNQRLHEYATDLKSFAASQQIHYADQFHALLDIWGHNKPKENLANALPTLRNLSQNNELPGVEHLRNFLSAQTQPQYQLVSMQGDPVHPGIPGQLMMAAALLKELGAEEFVSSATVDATGKVVDAKGCTVENVTIDNGTLKFERLDNCLPFPIPPEAFAVLPMYSPIYELSEYMLTIKGLKPGLYGVKVNGVTFPAQLSERVWEQGVNLTASANVPPVNPSQVNPIAAQGRVILAAVAAKESLVSQWRGLSQRAHAEGAAPELKIQLAAQTKNVEEADAKIREAARPQRLQFEVFSAP